MHAQGVRLTAARLIFWLCFALLLYPVLMLLGLTLFGYFALGGTWPVPYFAVLACAEIASLILYFGWPWIAVLISWVDLLMILSGAIPWREHSSRAFVEQFRYNLMYFGLAHIGFLAWRFGGLKAWRATHNS